ncbi:hypothetical protein ACLMAJ_35925 [Nocardia sp. KC 131]|uniref:hypothetical protein n=1 Tax=Nocardia arseniciresistens TaxID=3392119 RepID=UPI00398EBAF8
MFVHAAEGSRAYPVTCPARFSTMRSSRDTARQQIEDMLTLKVTLPRTEPSDEQVFFRASLESSSGGLTCQFNSNTLNLRA